MILASFISIAHYNWVQKCPGNLDKDFMSDVLTLLADTKGADWKRTNLCGEGKFEPTTLHSCKEMAVYNKNLSIQDFGAVGDGIHDDTWAFESAIALIAHAGGGRLIVTGSGNENEEVVYRLRPINLTSHMELVLCTGVRMKAISHESTWPIIPPLPSYGQGRDHPGPRRTSFIHGENLTNVTIRGHSSHSSIIDGSGFTWWVKHKSGNETITRGSLVEFMYSSNIRLLDIKLVNSPFWTVHPYDCDEVYIRNVNIQSPLNSPNTDGFDPDSSRNVVIEDSSYVGGDDCVAIKSGWDCYGVEYGVPSRDIHIRNLTCYVTQISFGSEMSGGIENVLLEQIYFPNTLWHVAKLKTGETRGGYIRNITIRDVEVTGQMNSSALYINMDLYSGSSGLNPSCDSEWTPPSLSVVEDLHFHRWNGLSSSFYGKSVFDFEGMNGSVIQNMHLSHLYFHPVTSPSAENWICANVGNAYIRNNTVTPWPPCPEIQIVGSKDVAREEIVLLATAIVPPLWNQHFHHFLWLQFLCVALWLLVRSCSPLAKARAGS